MSLRYSNYEEFQQWVMSSGTILFKVLSDSPTIVTGEFTIYDDYDWIAGATVRISELFVDEKHGCAVLTVHRRKEILNYEYYVDYRMLEPIISEELSLY